MPNIIDCIDIKGWYMNNIGCVGVNWKVIKLWGLTNNIRAPEKGLIERERTIERKRETHRERE